MLTLALVLAVALPSLIGAQASPPPATSQISVSVQSLASELVQRAAGAAAAAEKDWATRFVGRVTRRDGTPRAAADVLQPAINSIRSAADLKTRLDTLQVRATRTDADAAAVIAEMETIIEEALVTRWELAKAEADLALQLVQAEHDAAIAEAQLRLQQRTDPDAYAAAEGLARHTASTDFLGAASDLVAARERALRGLERWASATAAQASTLKRIADFSAAHLDTSSNCEGSAQTPLDRFACAREILLAGGAGAAPPARLRLADAFDPLDSADEGRAVADGGGAYFFRESATPRLVAGSRSLDLRRTRAQLPPAIASKIAHGSRLILYYGRGLVPTSGERPRIQSEDKSVTYEVLGAHGNLVRPSELAPAMAESWMYATWFELTRRLVRADPDDPAQTAVALADKVLVFAHVRPGALPGQKDLRIDDVPAYWILENGTAHADAVFVREIGPGEYEPITHGFLGEDVRVMVRTDADIDADELPVTVGADARTAPQTRAMSAALSRSLVATKDPAEPRRFLTPPIRLASLPDWIRIPAGDALPAFHDDGFTAGSDTNLVVLRSVARLTVARDAEAVLNSWSRAVRHVAQLHGATVGPDVKAFLRGPAKQFETYQWFRLTWYGTTETVQEKITVSLGDHAALLLLRDQFIRLMQAVESDMVAAKSSLAENDSAVRGYLRLLEAELGESWSPWRLVPVKGLGWPERRRTEQPPAESASPESRRYRDGNDPIARFAGRLTTNLSNLVDESLMELRRQVPLSWVNDPEYLARLPNPETWRLAAMREALGWYLEKVRAARKDALQIKDNDVRGLLELVRTGFEPVVDRVVHDLVQLVAEPGLGPVWEPNRVARAYVRGVSTTAQVLAAGHEVAELTRAVAVTALGAATLLTAPEAAAFRVLSATMAAGGVADVSLVTLPEFFRRQQDVEFAWGASRVLGIGRLHEAEARAIPAWMLLMDTMLAGLGAFGDFNTLVSQVRMTSEAGRAAAILRQMSQGEGLETLIKMRAEDQAVVAAFTGEALANRRAGRPITPVQQQALDFHGGGLNRQLRDLGRELEHGRRQWTGRSETVTRPRRTPTVPPTNYPPARPRPGVDTVVQAFDATGKPVTYRTGNLIGEGLHSYVYEVLGDPSVVLKFPKSSGLTADEWLDEATRVAGLLRERGIRHLEVTAIMPNGPLPFYAQRRLPEGARTFELERRISGYRPLRPGTEIPPNPTPEQLMGLADRHLVRLEYAWGLAGGETLPRPIQRAILRLFKRLGAANSDLAAEDLRLENLYFERVGLRWEAGILDLERIGPWRTLADVDPALAEMVLDIELHQNRARNIASLAGRSYADDERALRELGAERLFPDADFFMEKMLEDKGYIRYLPGEKRWTGPLIDLDLVREYFPHLDRHVSRSLLEILDERGTVIPGPTLPPDLEPLPGIDWSRVAPSQGPPTPAPKLPVAEPIAPPRRYDPDAPTGRDKPLANAAAPRPARRSRPVGIPEGAVQPGDLVFGLHNKSPVGLVDWAHARGGRTMGDIDDRIEALGTYENHPMNAAGRSLAAIDVAIADRIQLRFDLNGVDVDGVWTEGSRVFKAVTSQELRHIAANWARFRLQPKFYRDGSEVPPPWSGFDPDGPDSGTAPRPPRPSDRIPSPPEFTLSPPRPSSSGSDTTTKSRPRASVSREPTVAEAVAQWEAAMKRRSSVEEPARAARERALEAARSAAPRFDLSRLPDNIRNSRRTRPPNSTDGLAPVRHLIDGDTHYLENIMRGSNFHATQPFVYFDVVNDYVTQILTGQPFPPGRNNTRILIDKEGAIQEGHHRIVAAQIVSRLTGRPLFVGPSRIIPQSAVVFDAEVQAPKLPRGWNIRVEHSPSSSATPRR